MYEYEQTGSISFNNTPGRQYKVTIKGKTTAADPIDIDLTSDNKVFTCRSAVVIVASNMKDANGNPLSNLLPSTEL
jgi:hypothetical protein